MKILYIANCQIKKLKILRYSQLDKEHDGAFNFIETPIILVNERHNATIVSLVAF